MTDDLVILVEGPSDVKVLNEIKLKLGLRCKVRKADGDGPLKQIFSNPKELEYFATRYGKVVGLFDSHCTDPQVRISEIEEALGPPRQRFPNVHYCIVQHAIETWLIADENAVSRAFPRWRRITIANPEIDCRPEEILEDAAPVFKNRYHKTRHAGRIASHLDLDRVVEKCSSFRRFKELVLAEENE